MKQSDQELWRSEKGLFYLLPVAQNKERNYNLILSVKAVPILVENS